MTWGRLLPPGLMYGSLPRMGQQTESPTAKPGDPCPLCGEGVLMPSPSGLNLECDTCNRITLLPMTHSVDDRPNAAGHERTPGRPRDVVKKREIRMAAVNR